MTAAEWLACDDPDPMLDFVERMPLPADAVMDAGCDDERVSGHCRIPGPHARGCWVVDLVLGSG